MFIHIYFMLTSTEVEEVIVKTLFIIWIAYKIDNLKDRALFLNQKWRSTQILL